MPISYATASPPGNRLDIQAAVKRTEPPGSKPGGCDGNRPCALDARVADGRGQDTLEVVDETARRQ